MADEIIKASTGTKKEERGAVNNPFNEVGGNIGDALGGVLGGLFK